MDWSVEPLLVYYTHTVLNYTFDLVTLSSSSVQTLMAIEWSSVRMKN